MSIYLQGETPPQDILQKTKKTATLTGNGAVELINYIYYRILN